MKTYIAVLLPVDKANMRLLLLHFHRSIRETY
jgi:hypothetical protein